MRIESSRAARVVQQESSTTSYLEGLLELAVRGLPASRLSDPIGFAQTVRGMRGQPAPSVRAEGRNLRYGAIVSLGVSGLDISTQRQVLDGRTACDLAVASADQARGHNDPGSVAVAAWALAEVADTFDDELFARVGALLRSDVPLATVDLSWMLTAGVMAAPLGPTGQIIESATSRLLAAQGSGGIYPHWSQPAVNDRWRSPIGSFADQIYPIQALSRAAVATGDEDALKAADRTAQRICELQGDAGQWWWHYDARTGDVAERYPVYSVHQYGMAPMALLELAEAGGRDRSSAVAQGLSWLQTHPEVVQELVADRHNLVWRKVGRREPRKASRTLAAVGGAISPGLHPPVIDRIFPAVAVDYECRPYELGWLLYCWLKSPLPRLAQNRAEGAVPVPVQRNGPAKQRRAMFGLNLDALTLPEVVALCDEAIESRSRMTVGVVNAAKVVNLRSDELLRSSLVGCDLLLADGQSVVWAGRALGHRLPERVAGIDLFEALLDHGARRGRSVYLLGARREVLERVIRVVGKRWPDLRIAGAHDGYFSESEASRVVDDIAASGADMLFLGMTSPKKEIFLSRYGGELRVPVLHGVGGSFDVLAGVTRRAPQAWQRLGMEWAYRLSQEPRRLGGRYLRTNAAFLGLLARESVHPSALFSAAPRQTPGGHHG